jgi:ABC-2 type transport system permease protein
MYTTYMLTITSLKMFLRNRQAIFFSLFMPLMILMIFGSINFDKAPKVKLGLATRQPSTITAEMAKQLQSIDGMEVDTGTLDAELKELRDGNRSAVLELPDDATPPSTAGAPRSLTLHLNGSHLQEGQAARAILQQFSARASLAAAGAPLLFTVDPKIDDSHAGRYIEFLLPGIIAMSVMQMSVFSVAFVFARYREQGVLKRLAATPMRPHQFVTANILTRLTTSLGQAAVFLIVGMLIFHVQVQGPLWLLIASVILGSVMFLGLGFTISGMARTTETVPVYSNLIVFPMLFLGNVFFATSSMPAWLRAVANYLPLTYFSTVLRGIMAEGQGLWELRGPLTGLALWTALLITTATLTFRLGEKDS